MKKTMAFVLLSALVFLGAGGQASAGLPPIPLASGGAGQGLPGQAEVRALASPGPEIPQLQEKQWGVVVHTGARAVVDASNAGEGYVDVKYTGGKKVKVLVQIYLTSDNKYNYNLNQQGSFETFPLSEGDGTYTVRVMENIEGNKYAAVHTCQVEVKLRSELLPFLYANSTVNYAQAPKAVAKAAELAEGCGSDLEKVEKIYRYVVGGVAYDYDFAKKVVAGTVTGHVPNLDATLETGKGICFDYAALMAGMLRSQGVPARLVKGYAGTVYHAWIDVYIKGVGWIDKIIQFDGTRWTMMDPTFVSTYGKPDAVARFLEGGSSYRPQQLY